MKPVPFDGEKEYKVAVRCKNCGYFFTLIKPRGVMVTEVERCPHCSCHSARRVQREEYSLNLTDPLHEHRWDSTPTME